MAIYNKALPTGISAVLVYTGTNLDEIIALVGIANVNYSLGYLRVGAEPIEIGDAVTMTDDEPPVLAPKITAATLVADQQIIEACVYDLTNIDEIVALAGKQNVQVRASGLYVNNTLVAENDAVSTCGNVVSVIPAADLAATWTVES